MTILDDPHEGGADGALFRADDDGATNRLEIYQAQGMLTIQLGVGLPGAMARLRAYAFANDRRLADVAYDIVTRKLSLQKPMTGTDPHEGEHTMTVISPARLASVFVELADTLIDEFDLIEFLQLVTTRVSELTEATAAGLLLADHRERLHFMAASDENMRNLELFQVQADEGPCRDCFHLGTPVVNADLARATDRWPRFARRAVDAGFHSVHAFPLRLRSQTIGALGLFSRATGNLAPDDVILVQALADVATIGLLQERAVRHSETVTAQLQEAQTSRIVIEQAKGVIAQTLGISVDDAFTQLRTYCRTNYLLLRDVAQDITIERSESRHLRTLSKEAEPGN